MGVLDLNGIIQDYQALTCVCASLFCRCGCSPTWSRHHTINSRRLNKCEIIMVFKKQLVYNYKHRLLVTRYYKGFML